MAGPGQGRDRVQVRPGFWRPDGFNISESLQAEKDRIQAVVCPWGESACLGGDVHGDLSCFEGHHGLLCGLCNYTAGYYRGKDGCYQCPNQLFRSSEKRWWI